MSSTYMFIMLHSKLQCRESPWSHPMLVSLQDKLCLGDDVCSVLQDLERQWKKGNLPSMLPVMDFLIWSLLQEHTNEVSPSCKL